MTGSRSASTLTTLRWVHSDSPRSPRRSSAIQRGTAGGAAGRGRAGRASRPGSGVAEVGNIRLTTSPGMKRMIRNTMTLTRTQRRHHEQEPLAQVPRHGEPASTCGARGARTRPSGSLQPDVHERRRVAVAPYGEHVALDAVADHGEQTRPAAGTRGTSARGRSARTGRSAWLASPRWTPRAAPWTSSVTFGSFRWIWLRVSPGV